MYGAFQEHLEREINAIREAGFYKEERVIATPQGAEIGVTGGKSVINMCANNYLGLAQDERILRADREPLRALDVFLERCGARLGRRITRVEPEAVRAFCEHVWARGFKDFEIAVESLIAFSPDGTVSAEAAIQALSDLASPLERIAQRRRQREREQLIDLFEKHGSFSGVARELGITRNAAKYRLAKHRLIPRSPLRHF